MVKLLALLIASNILWATYAFLSYLQLTTTEDVGLWIWAQASVYTISDMCFCISHWMFAFEYYCSSRYMPYLLSQSLPEASMVKCDEIIYIVVFVLNTLAPIANGVSILLVNLCEKNNG